MARSLGDEVGATYWQSVFRQRVSRRRSLAMGAAAGASAAVLAACGGSSGGNKATGSGAAPSLITQPVDTTKTAKRGGDYLSSRTSDIDQNDPHFTTQAAPGTAQTYSRLFRRKPGVLGPQPFEFIGDLADSYEFSPDKLAMTVKLKASKWHPVPPVNGRAVDAQDVAFTWKRLEAMGANRSLLAHSVSPGAPI